MTTADMPFRQGRNPRFDKIATRLAHWTPAMLMAMPVSMALAAFTQRFTGFWGSVLLASVSTATLLVAATVIQAWHIYAICPVCARKIPLDPAKAIARRHRRLRLLHWLGEKHAKTLNRTQIGLFVLSFVPWVSYFAFTTLMLLLAFGVYLGNVHMPLQPWCPQCRGSWGKGEDKEVVPDPDPVGSEEKVS